MDKLVEKSAFENFINLERKLIRNFGDQFIRTEIPIIQLEALCLYSFDATYKQLCDDNEIYFYKYNDRIRFIPTDLGCEFEPTLLSVLNAFKKADEQGVSPRIKKRVSEIFIKETERLCQDLSSGRIPTQDYLKELKQSMQQCDVGFGVSIPKFEKYWEKNGKDSKSGDDILALNLKQAEGTLVEDGKAKQTKAWIRIFFVEGVNGKNQLSADEKAMLVKQLVNKVNVFIVFHGAWKDLKGDKLKLCDFAVFRTDDHPTIMITKFHVDDADGVFHYNADKAEQHYNEYLSKVLKTENGKYVFKPKLNKDKTTVVLGDALGEMGILGLTDKLLKEIYKKSK